MTAAHLEMGKTPPGSSVHPPSNGPKCNNSRQEEADCLVSDVQDGSDLSSLNLSRRTLRKSSGNRGTSGPSILSCTPSFTDALLLPILEEEHLIGDENTHGLHLSPKTPLPPPAVHQSTLAVIECILRILGQCPSLTSSV